MSGAIEKREGRMDAARAAWSALDRRISTNAPPEYVFRPKLSSWELVHTIPEVDRTQLREWQR